MSTSNTCAVCGCAIGLSYLMCARHWHAVPRELKTRVYRAWAGVRRGSGGRDERRAAIDEYRLARDAAIASARGAGQHGD